MLKKIFAFCLFSFLFLTSFSQVREIPNEVRESFRNQYPNADNIRFSDQLVIVYVHFTVDSIKHSATYNNKGEWKETEKIISFDDFSDDVKDGFQKSKYADWGVEETAIVTRPGKPEEFRIKVSKSDLQKKYLYFNSRGRLKRDAITI